MMTKHEPQRDDFDIWPIKSPTGAGQIKNRSMMLVVVGALIVMDVAIHLSQII